MEFYFEIVTKKNFNEDYSISVCYSTLKDSVAMKRKKKDTRLNAGGLYTVDRRMAKKKN